MSLFSNNLRYLRQEREETQQRTAETLGLKRSRYEPYESGKIEPPYAILVDISKHFGVSIDLLLTVDVRKYRVEELLKLDDNRILLPIKVDNEGNDLIEIVPFKAQAGYLSGYADPEFIDDLQQFSLPFLGHGKFRAFAVSGDSMPPHDGETFIIARYVENKDTIKTGKTYVFITASDGISYKRLQRKDAVSLTLQSDNPDYAPYEVNWGELLEIWEYVSHIGRNDAVPEHFPDTVADMFLELRKEIRELRK